MHYDWLLTEQFSFYIGYFLNKKKSYTFLSTCISLRMSNRNKSFVKYNLDLYLIGTLSSERKER